MRKLNKKEKEKEKEIHKNAIKIFIRNKLREISKGLTCLAFFLLEVGNYLFGFVFQPLEQGPPPPIFLTWFVGLLVIQCPYCKNPSNGVAKGEKYELLKKMIKNKIADKTKTKTVCKYCKGKGMKSRGVCSNCDGFGYYYT